MKLNDLPKIDAALAPQAISTDVLLEKYAKGTESSAEDIHHRVSIALAAVAGSWLVSLAVIAGPGSARGCLRGSGGGIRTPDTRIMIPLL